jgi:hypothetical protein
MRRAALAAMIVKASLKLVRARSNAHERPRVVIGTISVEVHMRYGIAVKSKEVVHRGS